MGTPDDQASAIVYLRTSVTGEAAGAVLGIQEKAAREWADQNGYSVIRVVADVGRRSQLGEVLEAIRDEEVRALAISSTETLGGSGGAAVLLALNQAGGVLLSAKEKIAATGLFNR